MYNDSMIIFSQDLPNSQELSVLMTFGFSDGLRNFRKSFPSPESFRLARIRLIPLIGWILYNDCITVMVSKLTSFTNNFVDLLLPSHRVFLPEVRLRHCVFCMGPCKLGSLADCAISVFWEMGMHILLL